MNTGELLNRVEKLNKKAMSAAERILESGDDEHREYAEALLAESERGLEIVAEKRREIDELG